MLCIKKLLTITLTAAFFLISGMTTSVHATLTDGLVAYYPFNGNANDESGNANNGTVNGATLTADRSGNANKAYSFDGIDDRIKLPNTIISSVPMTLNLWVKTDDVEGSLISGATDSTTHNEYLLYWDKITTSSNIHIYYHDSDGTSKTQTNIKINDGIWHMLSVTTMSDKTVIYVDGRFAETALFGSNGSFNIQGLWLGAEQDCVDGCFVTNEQFSGSMDDVRIYNRALSSSEIQELYTGTPPSNLVLSVSPASSSVSSSAGTTSFAVSNAGTGTMNWTAAVTSATWLKITSGSSGSNTGTINCAFEANTTTSARTATIRVTANGATGSPKDITVTQAAASSTAKSSLTLSSASGSPSGTVTVNLSFTNVTGVNVAAISTDIDFDSAIFEAYPSDAANTKNPVAVIGAAGTAAGKRVISNLVDSNTLRVGIYSENTTAIANGVVASITFYIKSTAINGSTTDLTQIPSGSDSNSNDVTITGTKGTVTINSCKLGDCDCNGTVSIAEVQSAVNMYLSKKTVASCCDRDGNGIVSISEVQAIVNNYLGIVPKSKHATRDKKQPAQVNIGVQMMDGYSLSLIPNKNSISAMSIDAAYPVELAGKISFTLGASAELAGKELVQNQIQPGITRIGLIDAFDNQAIDDGEILFVHVDGDSAKGDVSFKVTASDEAGGEIQVR